MAKIKKEYICPPGKKSSVVIEDLSVQIQPKATMMLGFAGVGLVGPIIANALIDQIPDIKQIGFITSEFLPPISVFYNGILKHPFRLYYSPKYNIIVGIIEVPFEAPSAYNDLSRTICNWALTDDVQASQVVVFQGIPQRGMIDEFPVYYAAERKLEEVENLGVEKVEKGVIAGPEATILNEALTNRLNPRAFFTPVFQIPTPEGAAAIVEVLNKIYGLEINTKPLIDEGKEIKDKMLELAEKAKEYQKKQLTQGGQGGYTEYYQ